MPEPTGLVAVALGALKATYGTMAPYWKDIGGAAIAFHALKSFVFGKNFRTIEYPDGELNTITLRKVSVEQLKQAIAAKNPPLKPNDISLCRWVSPHFTEKITTKQELKQVSDDGWIIWNRGPTLTVPTRFSLDKGFPLTDPIVDNVLKLLSDMYYSLDTSLHMDEDDHSQLVMMAAAKDEGLFLLFRRFGKDPEKFRKYALLYLNNKRAENIQKMSKVHQAGGAAALPPKKKKKGSKKPGEEGEDELVLEEDEEEEEKQHRTTQQQGVDSVTVSVVDNGGA